MLGVVEITRPIGRAFIGGGCLSGRRGSVGDEMIMHEDTGHRARKSS